jgi:hypothetical protein
MGRKRSGIADERVIRAALADRDLELVSVDERLPDGTIAATASKLHLIPTTDGKPLYVPIPVALQIKRDDRGDIHSVTGDVPGAGAVADAARFVKSLVANHQLAEANGIAPPGATHQVEIDAKGRRILRRRRFSAF